MGMVFHGGRCELPHIRVRTYIARAAMPSNRHFMTITPSPTEAPLTTRTYIWRHFCYAIYGRCTYDVYDIYTGMCDSILFPVNGKVTPGRWWFCSLVKQVAGSVRGTTAVDAFNLSYICIRYRTQYITIRKNNANEVYEELDWNLERNDTWNSSN